MMEDRTVLHNDEQADESLSYLLGQMPEHEERAFEARLAPGSPQAALLADQMDSLTAMAERIASTMPAPRRGLKDLMMATVISRTPQFDGQLQATKTPHIVLGGDEGWTNSGMAGLDLKVLYEDKASARYTVLARFAPGTHHPKHRHVGTEECYVVQGDLHMNDLNLKAGDFIINEDGALHEDTWSTEGCILLLSTELRDEMLVA